MGPTDCARTDLPNGSGTVHLCRALTPLLTLTLLLATSASVVGDDSPETPTEGVVENAVEPARIEAWITDLGADSYKSRETAKRKLVEAGVDAVEPVVAAANQRNLEVAVRALRIFETILVRVETDEEIEVVEDALDDLLTSKNPATATRAEVIAEGMHVVREKRAIAKLESLGADVEINDEAIVVVQGRAVQSSVTVVLDPEAWKGGDDGLKYLSRVTRLNRVYLVDDVVSDEARTELAAAMPNLDIQGRGRAYLGVGGAMLAAGNGCFVQTVKEGTAAAKAGIEPGDVIQQFAGKPVPGFAELVDLIGAQKPGDTVVAQVLRNGVDTVKLKVTLGRWADNETKPAVKGPRPAFPPVVPPPPPDPPPNRPPP